jgi:hypothetical protein
VTVGRRPEPETIDAVPPRKPIRPYQGYRAGAKISAGDAGRARLAGAIAIGIVLAGIAFSAIGPLLPELPEVPPGPLPSRTVATPLPDIAIPPPGPTRVPVTAGGPVLIREGRCPGMPYTAPRGAMFVDATAGPVRVRGPWSQDRLVVRVTPAVIATGEEVARVTLSSLESPWGGPASRSGYAAISPDGRQL